MQLRPGELQEILKIFVDSDLQELQLQVGDVSLAVSKNDTGGGVEFSSLPPQAASATGQEAATAAAQSTPATESLPAQPDAAAAPAEPSVVDRTGLHALRSPLVGVFYRRPGPDQPPYVEVGDEVKAGDPVCTISVMKMFTEVGADRSGRVVEICVENETLVEHGQVLMYIDPSDS